MARLKVWGGLTNNLVVPSANGGKQARTIVCALSKRAAVNLLLETKTVYRFTLHEFNNYWGETGNEAELMVATRPGVWVTQKAFSAKPSDYAEMGEKHG